MPTSPLTVCAQPGCPLRVPRGYCATHARTSPRNHRGVPRQAREHGTAYDRLAREMRGQPCSLRLTGCTGSATGADLIVPRSQGGRAVPGNVRPACGHCQSVQGGRMRGYGGQKSAVGGRSRTARQPAFALYDLPKQDGLDG